MSMNPPPRKHTKSDKDLIDEYLKNGGKIEKLPAMQRSEEIEYTAGFYGRKKKPKKD